MRESLVFLHSYYKLDAEWQLQFFGPGSLRNNTIITCTDYSKTISFDIHSKYYPRNFNFPNAVKYMIKEP